ncbi:hypothetical protein [Streptomyces sp. TLI_171]|uniref:hypothetical protein n=1 Tax=Streptomyces sp. TLI_171 TaxID=1938859 RepID=UPI000C1A75DB|nr:hypothetical protein [Streptomyces sp. TLI_171]RKE21133.1 hypothetical protein BX266_4511 [Streptomyces sp. TLI_171]
MMIPHDQVRFVSGASAPILLLGGVPVHEALPVLRTSDGAVPALDGWQLVARLTLCLLDGPGDAGCVLPTLGSTAELDAVAAWCAQVEEVGGALVVSLPHRSDLAGPLDWPALLDGGAHGGFARSTG